jgi:hypothetical protein
MRTTLTIDDDVLSLAQALADSRNISIGKALSEMARRGMQPRLSGRSKSGFITFCANDSVGSFGEAEVCGAMDAEDAEKVAGLFRPR